MRRLPQGVFTTACSFDFVSLSAKSDTHRMENFRFIVNNQYHRILLLHSVILLYWDLERENRPSGLCGRSVMSPNPAAMGSNNGLTERESQPGAMYGAIHMPFAAVEARKDGILFTRSDAIPIISDIDA